MAARFSLLPVSRSIADVAMSEHGAYLGAYTREHRVPLFYYPRTC